MFGLGLATKIYVAIEAVDMRKGFDGLYGLVRDQLGQDPLSGYLFLLIFQSHAHAFEIPYSTNSPSSKGQSFAKETPVVVANPVAEAGNLGPRELLVNFRAVDENV